MSNYKLKLEVFKLTLKERDRISNPSFRNLFSLKFLDEQEDIEDAKLFNLYNKDLSEKLNNEGAYHQNK